MSDQEEQVEQVEEAPKGKELPPGVDFELKNQFIINGVIYPKGANRICLSPEVSQKDAEALREILLGRDESLESSK